MKRKLKENWKSYLVYGLLIVAVCIWFAVSNTDNDQPENKAYVAELESVEYIPYTSYGETMLTYSRLSDEYEAQGYTGTDEVITLLPKDADTEGQGVVEKNILEYAGEALRLGEQVDATWEFTVEKAGLYNIELDYAGIDGDGSKIQRSIILDGKIPCEEATNVYFYRYLTVFMLKLL